MRHSAPSGWQDLDLGRVDLADPALYSHGDPHAVWHALRQRSPVHWQAAGSTGFWSVTKYKDVEAVLRDTRTFSSERGTLLTLLGKGDPASRQQLSTTDPPRHTEMRAPVQRALVGKGALSHEQRVRQEARLLLEPALSGEPFDFAVAIHRLPVVTFGLLMDLPAADWPRLTELAEAAVAPDDPLHRLEGGAEETARRAHRELFAYFQDMAAARVKRPGDDLLSLLLSMPVEGRPLSRGAVLANCYLLLIGATVTVPEAPKAALVELMRTGGYPRWAADPSALDSGIEEALRWSSPANHVMRYATRPARIRGVPIAEGDAVVVWYGSANRDEEIFPDPYTYDIHRKPNRHLTFGAGAHFCVGFAIARMTLRVLFQEMFAMFSDFTPAGEVEHVASNFVAGITHLPLIGKPAAGARP